MQAAQALVPTRDEYMTPDNTVTHPHPRTLRPLPPQASLQSLRDSCPDKALVEVITMMATKPQQLAQYFCTGAQPDPGTWRHYALAVDMYTHFTSPIRRWV